MRVAFVNCTVLADYYTCNVQTLPLPTTPSYDPDVLTRMHSVIVSVVCLIGVLMIAGFVLCLVCTRGTSERTMVSSSKKDEEKAALPGLCTVSAAHAVLHPMLFTALARGDGLVETTDRLPPMNAHRPPRSSAARPATDTDDDDDDEFFGSRTSFHSECSLPATPTAPASTEVMLYGYQASRL
ncbi:hypothetical protein LSAT2_006221 [Lamellibrachia satsuma]|nr:hypothetical protein LSAT2_006221 [Lamellibrachia satsuma]